MPFIIESILIKYSELALRGKNRTVYENMLLNQIKQRLGFELGDGVTIIREQGRFLIEQKNHAQNQVDGFDFMPIITKLTQIPGIHSVCPCIKLKTHDVQTIEQAALHLVKLYYGNKSYTFKVNTRRADKRYPFNSMALSASVGQYLLTNMNQLLVDVHNPNFIIHIECRNDIYLYAKEYKGFGGLPVSSSGKALYLLSGGIDSPVASFLMACRGVYGEFMYFHSPPFVSVKAKQKVLDIAEKLSDYTGEIKLHIIPFTEVQLYLKEQVPSDKLTVFLKRSMLKIAALYADTMKMQALVVGDSVGQVASQTLAAMQAIDSAVDTTILRPLSGYSKNETISLAKKIGTYEISILPYDDCCTLFVDKHPETRPKKSVIEGIESNLYKLPELLAAALDNVETTLIGS